MRHGSACYRSAHSSGLPPSSASVQLLLLEWPFAIARLHALCSLEWPCAKLGSCYCLLEWPFAIARLHALRCTSGLSPSSALAAARTSGLSPSSALALLLARVASRHCSASTWDAFELSARVCMCAVSVSSVRTRALQRERAAARLRSVVSGNGSSNVRCLQHWRRREWEDEVTV